VLIIYSYAFFSGLLNDITNNRETIFPTRLSGSEWIKNHDVHKRDVSSQEHQDVVSFKFSAYGRQYLFDLSFTKDFISPNVVVERHDGNYSWIEDGFEGGLSDCFYIGKVNNDSSSRAVFNLCDGLVSVQFLFSPSLSLYICKIQIIALFTKMFIGA